MNADNESHIAAVFEHEQRWNAADFEATRGRGIFIHVELGHTRAPGHFRSLIAGAIMWHGPHYGTHISTKTGNGDRWISVEKVASVTVTGAEARRVFLHRAHNG